MENNIITNEVKEIEVGTEAVVTIEEVAEQKQAVNILDLLLGSDVGEIKLPTTKVEVIRLSEIYGAPFVITLSALSPDKFEAVQDMAVSIKGKDADIELSLLQMLAIIESVLDEQGKPLFKNKDLMAKFKVPTPKELVRKLLLSGEVTNIYKVISDLSGFGDNAVKSVKN